VANEFCLRSIYASSAEMIGILYDLDNLDSKAVDVDKVRFAVQGAPEPGKSMSDYHNKWEQIKTNMRAEARETLWYAFYDLGPEEGAKLRDHLKSRPELSHLSGQIDKVYADSRSWSQWGIRIWENKATYAGHVAKKGQGAFIDLNRHVHRHVLAQLGFDGVENMRHAGKWLTMQDVTWNWRQFGKSALWDPGSIDAGAQILRSFFESGGDLDVVSAKIADEMFLAIPIVGQAASMYRGGLASAGIMAVVMAVPQLGLVMVAYSVGDVTYAIYDMEYQRPKRENIIDAVFRGFAGPTTVAYGEPGKPLPVWNDQDDQTLFNLELQERVLNMGSASRAPISSAKRKEQRARLGKVVRHLAIMQKRKADFKAYRDAGSSWLGGLIWGEGAVLEQKHIEHYLIKDVQPQIGFFTKGAVDLRNQDTVDAQTFESKRSSLKKRIEEAEKSDPAAGLDASLELHQLRQQWRRFSYGQAIKEGKSKELKLRFVRDSLYLHLREKLGEVADEKVTKWAADWLNRNDQAVVDDLIAINLLEEDARTWRERAQQAVVNAQMQMAASQTGGSGKVDTHKVYWANCPVNLNLFKARVLAETARSRKLVEAHEMLMKDRDAVLQRNMQIAKDQFGIELARPGPDRLKKDDGMRDLIAAVRHVAVPRHAPKLEATVYKIKSNQSSSEPQAYDPDSALKDLQLSVKITADPTLYYPPYHVEPILLPINTKTWTVSGSTIPLLEQTRKTIDDLLDKLKKGDTEDWPSMLPTPRDDGQDWNVVLLSAIATDMADLEKAMPETYEHLPRVKAGSGYLMDQAITFIQAPPPPIIPQWWYLVRKFPNAPLFSRDPGNYPPIVKMRYEKDGSFTGTCDYKLYESGGSEYVYKLNLAGQITDIEGSKRTKRIEIEILEGIRSRGKRAAKFSGKIVGKGSVSGGWKAQWKAGDAAPPGEVTGTVGYSSGKLKPKTWRVNEIWLERYAGPGKPGEQTWTTDIGEWKLNTLGGGGNLHYEGIVVFTIDKLVSDTSPVAKYGLVRCSGINFNLFEGTWNLDGRMFKDKEDDTGKT